MSTVKTKSTLSVMIIHRQEYKEHGVRLGQFFDSYFLKTDIILDNGCSLFHEEDDSLVIEAINQFFIDTHNTEMTVQQVKERYKISS